jgi:hypothetical protein
MKISKIYQKFSEVLNKPDVLTDPEKYLGPNWKQVLNFWNYADELSDKTIVKIINRYKNFTENNINFWDDVWTLLYKETENVVGIDSRNAAFYASPFEAVKLATYELIALHKLKEKKT